MDSQVFLNDSTYISLQEAPMAQGSTMTAPGKDALEPMSMESLPLDPMPMDRMSANAMSSNPMTPNPMSANSMSSNLMSSNPMSSNPMSSNPMSSNPMSSNSMSSNPMASNPMSSNPMSSNPMSSNLMSSNPMSTNLMSPNSLSTNPMSTNPMSSNPMLSNPMSSNQMSTNPMSSNPMSSNPMSSNPMSSNPMSNQMSSNPMSSNPMSSNFMSTDSMSLDHISMDPMDSMTMDRMSMEPPVLPGDLMEGIIEGEQLLSSDTSAENSQQSTNRDLHILNIGGERPAHNTGGDPTQGDPNRGVLSRGNSIREDSSRGDLSRDLSREDLSRDLSQGDLSRGDLSRGDLSRGDLSRGDLSQGDPSRRDLSRGDLSRGDLSRGDLSRGDLSRGDLSRGDPSRGDPTRSDSTRGDPSRTDRQTVTAGADQQTDSTGEERSTESPSTGEGYHFKCTICDRILSAGDDPKLLECLHNACGSCVNNKLLEQSDTPEMPKGVQCMACGNISPPEKIIENQFLLDTAGANDESNKATEMKCSSCSDDAIATSWCGDCSEFICDSCVQAHQRLKITKDHTIKTKDEGLQEMHGSGSSMGQSNLMLCSIHPHEKLSLFCEHCDKLTCRDCQLIEHRDHKYKFTHEIALDTRKMIAGMLKDVSYKRVLLNSAMKVIADRQTQIVDKKQAIVKEITQLVVRLTNTINVRGKQLVTKLNEVCEAKQKTLEEKKQALEQISKMTDHCIEFTQHALDNGSDMALLYSKRQVTNHLHRIKSKRADIPNPEIPVRIHLALDKIPEVIKVLSTIGQIVVDGRVYPSQTTSPALSLPPQNSPSPSHLNQGLQPPQQPSPVSMNQQLQLQNAPQGFQLNQQQQPRMLPPYQQHNQHNQHYSQMGLNINQNMQQNMNKPAQQQQGPPQHMGNMQQHQQMSHNGNQNHNMQHPPPSIPISLAQQLNQNMQNHVQRMQMQRPGSIRPLMPMNRMPNAGMTSQQQVTSSTHPHGMMQDRSSLRGLLQPNGNAVYVQTGPLQYQAVQPQYAQQFQTRFQGPNPNQQQPQQQQQFRQQMRMGPPGNLQIRMPLQRPAQINQNFPPQQQQQQQQQQPVSNLQQGAKWHIPQQGGENSSTNQQSRNVSVLPTLNDNFKITLKSQNNTSNSTNGSSSAAGAVTSTIPKTPSPNHIQGRSDTEQNLDRYCQDSVKDLMATIAKLDSNGVQVLAEARPKTGGSPHVDSSTGDLTTGPPVKIKSDQTEMGKDDPNEDWCAVCMDGGELVCCDKCPKVFHQACHIPNLSVEENDTWQCLLCMNFADIPENILGPKKEGELSLKEKKIAERIVLELYCQYEPSLPFRDLVGPENIEYHSIIKNPIALDVIKRKLSWTEPGCYTHLDQLVKDVRLMFQNAYTYNDVDSQVYLDAKTLEKFFDEQLDKWLPELVYDQFDESVPPPNKKYKRIITD